MLILEGIAASPGIAIGKAFVYRRKDVEIRTDREIDADNELRRFHLALNHCQRYFECIKQKTSRRIGKDQADIFEAYLLILEDPDLISQIERGILEDGLNAEMAVENVIKNYVFKFQSMQQDYFKGRAVDIQDIGNKIMEHLVGETRYSLSDLNEKVVIITENLAPSDTAGMNAENVIGFATDMGNITSHTAIIARSLNIPAVVQLREITKKAFSGDKTIIDGTNGLVILNPDKKTLLRYSNIANKKVR